MQIKLAERWRMNKHGDFYLQEHPTCVQLQVSLYVDKIYLVHFRWDFSSPKICKPRFEPKYVFLNSFSVKTFVVVVLIGSN